MKILTIIIAQLFTFYSGFLCPKAFSQCAPVSLADSSFESGSLTEGGFPYLPGRWYVEDGCDVSGNHAYVGDSSCCSLAGGAFQVIPVDSHTTYYVSCYVLNGASDANLSFKVNWIPHPISTSSDSWSFVSQSFNSRSDSVAILGFYSDGACFDQFRVTCFPLVGIPDQMAVPAYSIYPTVSSNQFTLKTSNPCKIDVVDLNGRVIMQVETEKGQHYFGQTLPASTYVLRIKSTGRIWFERIIKI